MCVCVCVCVYLKMIEESLMVYLYLGFEVSE